MTMLKWFATGMLALCTMSAAALGDELLLVHGHIYTGNPRAPWAEALAVDDARIAAIGRLLLFGAYALHGLNLLTPESSVTADKPDAAHHRQDTRHTDHGRR